MCLDGTILYVASLSHCISIQGHCSVYMLYWGNLMVPINDIDREKSSTPQI